jgi:hypothetical protein
MNVRELQDVLHKLEDVYASAGAKKQAGSVAALAKSLDGNPELSIDELVANIRQKLSSSSSGKPVAETVIDLALVAEYAAGLASAGTDRAGFDQVFEQMKIDPAVKIAEIYAIANRYKNDPTDGKFVFKFTSKREALDFIFDTYIGRAQAESKAGIIDRITRWATN